MNVPELDIDLKQPPGERWRGLARFADAGRELLACYSEDIGGTHSFGDLLVAYRDSVVEPEYAAEMTRHRRVARCPGGGGAAGQLLLLEERPQTPDDCYAVVEDPRVRMKITMQSMAFRPRTGQYSVRIPDPPLQ